MVSPRPSIAVPTGSARVRGRPGLLPVIAVAAPAALSLILSVATVHRRALWRDEMSTWQFSRLSFVDLIRAAHHVDAVLTPYYALMHVWQWFLSPAAALRVPSMVAAAATVAVVGATATRLWDEWAGLAAGLALALDGAFGASAVEARPYALAMLGCAVATDFLVRARTSPRSRRVWIGYALSSAFAVSMQLFSVLVLAAHLFVALIWFGRTAAARLRFAGAIVAPIAAAGVLALAAAGQHAQLSWVRPRSVDQAVQIVAAAVGQAHPWHGWLVVAALVLAGLRSLRSRSTGWLVGAALLILPAVCLFLVSGISHPAFVQRYLIAAPLGAALVIGGALADLRSWARPVGVVLVLAAVLLAGLPALQADFSHRSVDEFPELTALLGKRVRPGDWVVVGQDFASGGVAAGFAYYGDDRAFRRRVVAALPGGAPQIFARRSTGRSGTTGGTPHGRTWLIGLVRSWAGETLPYGYQQLGALGCAPDTTAPVVRTHGYGLLSMRCP